MTTVAWVFILVGLYLIRGLSKGRTIAEAPNDLGDLFIGLVTGDQAQVKEVLARTSSSAVDAVNGEPVIQGTFSVLPSKAGPAILQNAKRLGSAAKGYRLGATGPTYYDCSGLVWRTLKLMKVYDGPRFTVATFTTQVKCIQVTAKTAQPGDIVVWFRALTHHMGIVEDPVAGTFYSARSSKTGIGTSHIAGFNTFDPTYWRIPS